MKRSGQGFFALPRRDYRHERMALLIRSMPEDRPVGSWGLVRILLHGREESLTVKQAKHLCERMIASAERNGFIRRLPVKAASRAPIPDERLGLQRELQFVATEYGREFVRRHDSYVNTFIEDRRTRPWVRDIRHRDDLQPIGEQK